MIASPFATLAEMKVAETGRVRQLVGTPAVQQRLSEMGLTAGSTVRVVRMAPLGDPVQIAVRSYHLSLRRDETRCVIVDRNGSDQPAPPVLPSTTSPRG